MTAALITNMMGVDPARVRALALEQTIEALAACRLVQKSSVVVGHLYAHNGQDLEVANMFQDTSQNH